MSVQTTQYVLWGLKFPYEDKEFLKIFNIKDWNEYEKVYDQVIEPYIDSAYNGIISYGGLSIIEDGMNGEYRIIGYVLNKSDHDTNDLSDNTQQYKTPSEVENIFKDQLNYNCKVELIAITHYR